MRGDKVDEMRYGGPVTPAEAARALSQGVFPVDTCRRITGNRFPDRLADEYRQRFDDKGDRQAQFVKAYLAGWGRNGNAMGRETFLSAFDDRIAGHEVLARIPKLGENGDLVFIACFWLEFGESVPLQVRTYYEGFLRAKCPRNAGRKTPYGPPRPPREASASPAG